ncbi:MAG TPA: choice-of-anchor Q domain-containing protein, partial [Solirubrobacterales bacterium]|nr:choice-of-anchor Q domain-containing protein [Solirubrobacterales bacterium]
MKKLKITIAALTALLAVTLSVGTAAAVTIPVDTTADTFKNDPTTCSLREAISAANYDQPVDGCPSGTDGDVVSVPGGTYKIEIAGPDNLGVRGDFDVFWADDLSIVPASADAKVIIDANGVDRVFHQLAGAGKLVIRDMTIMNGNAFDSAGILLGESFELSGLTITGNSAKIAGGIGVVNQGSTGTVVNSTISGNKAEIDGGAIAVDDESSITVKNSTITGNVADSDANGIGDGGGINATAFDASVTLVNTINAGNSDLSPDPADQFSDCRTGPNFFPRYVVSTQAMGQAGCLVGFDPGTNKTVPDVKLSPLADNGGVTPTHMPMAGSPVIDAGGSTAPDLCPEADQVGTVRAPGKCDIGAVEYVEPVIPEPEPDPQPLPGIKVPS